MGYKLWSYLKSWQFSLCGKVRLQIVFPPKYKNEFKPQLGYYPTSLDCSYNKEDTEIMGAKKEYWPWSALWYKWPLSMLRIQSFSKGELGIMW